MSFESELRAILEKVDGAQAAAIMGFDGIVVADLKSPSFTASYQEIGVEFTRLLKEASKIGQGNDLGGLEEISVTTERFRYVLHVLNPEYFVLLVLSPGASLGKGRYYIKRAAPGIHKEL